MRESSRITVTVRGRELQHELSLDAKNFTANSPLKNNATFKTSFFQNSNNSNHFNNNSSLLEMNNPYHTLLNNGLSQFSYQSNCFSNKSSNDSNISLKSRAISLNQRTRVFERRLFVQQYANNQATLPDFDPELKIQNISALPRPHAKSQHNIEVLTTQKRNYIDKLQRHQELISIKYRQASQQQEQLQQKQLLLVHAQQEAFLDAQEKTNKEHFWKEWKSARGLLQDIEKQVEVEKLRETTRLNDFAKKKYYQSFTKLPRCFFHKTMMKNEDENGDNNLRQQMNQKNKQQQQQQYYQTIEDI